MRRHLLIIVTLALVVLMLIGINTASYVRVEKTGDSEMLPDRSTFNSGPTGTRALYDFLHESGYQVARWRESPVTLLSATGAKLSTIVIVGGTMIPIRDDEAEALMHWVRDGGRLVIVDRNMDPDLLPPSGPWIIKSRLTRFPFEVDPANFEQMTAGVKPLAPAQPTLFARDVASVLPSQFAGDLTLELKTEAKAKSRNRHRSANDNQSDDDQSFTEEAAFAGSPAPVVHLARESGALLIDYAHGKGRIVLLSDPFIVANNGISRADNLQLAVNVIAGYGGLIAFDEFHQGHATAQNALIQYFSGTPVVALFIQLSLIVIIIVWSRGRRFARPLPLPHIDRRSSLEFVASMAELQQRAHAYDLALENIYARVRRVLVRYAGANNHSPRAEVARRVAARSNLKEQELESLMRNCEDVINGAPTNARRSLDLARRLRNIEAALGLRMRAREAKQAAEKV